MVNRAVLECVDDLLKRICCTNKPFGGKIFACAGDFRQTCPVVRRGSRAQIVHASILSSPLWKHFQIRRLTVPIRNSADPEFAKYVDEIGDGAGPVVDIPCVNQVENVREAIDFIYPPDVLANPQACLSRSILAPTNMQVDSYNDLVLDRFDAEERIYFAADSLKEADDLGVVPPSSTLDYVARRTPPGLPPHSLRIKVGGIYRLMRNLSLDKGLVKNTRCVVTHLGRRLITVRILRGAATSAVCEEEDILIPRINFTCTISASKYTLLRKQFPLAPAYATTFNSCQGLTLDRVIIDLTRPVFSHGQLYTALSRVRHRTHARIRLHPGGRTTENVTFTELLI